MNFEQREKEVQEYMTRLRESFPYMKIICRIPDKNTTSIRGIEQMSISIGEFSTVIGWNNFVPDAFQSISDRLFKRLTEVHLDLGWCMRRHRYNYLGI